MPEVGFVPEGFEAGFQVRPPLALGPIFTDLEGRRFFDESTPRGHGHALVNGKYLIFPDRPMYVVFDARMLTAGPLGWSLEVGPWGWNKLVEGYRWSEDNSAEIERGWIKTAATPAALAAELGIDPEVLAATIADYNAGCAAGEDHFGRDPATLVPLERAPFAAYRSDPVFFFTCGGPRRNARAEVIGVDGGVIAGLYAAGEVSSTYSWGVDSGMMVGDALAFGRVAGREAAGRVG